MNIKKKHTGSDLTIFSEMSALALKHNAINLSQGFPDYEIDPKLKKLLSKATEENHNQYAPLSGNPQLIQNLVTFNQNRAKPISVSQNEITIVPGATYGIYTALSTILSPGDEVIVFEPCYDSYVPSIEMNGGIPIFVALDDNFEPNWENFKKALSEKTRAVIINSPHNPTGKIWNSKNFESLWNNIKDSEIFVISDEVYDLLIYDENEFYSAFHHSELRKRSFCIFSFGKMFHITGWKIGYVIANEDLSIAFRRIHQYLTFCVNAPAQKALADYLEIFDVQKNKNELQDKRNYFIERLSETPFKILDKAEGGYFQIANFKEIQPKMNDKEFSVWITKKIKVAVIPVSAFYSAKEDTGRIRFCFTKKQETIDKAILNLKQLF